MTSKVLILALILSLVIGAVAIDANAINPRLSPMLQDINPESGPVDSLISVIVFLDNSEIEQQVAFAGDNPNMTRSSRIRQVTAKLRSYKSAFAPAVENWLTANAEGNWKKFWIVPAYSATVRTSQVDALSMLDGVSLVIPDVDVEFDPPVETKSSPELASSVSTQLQMLKVPDLWKKGLTGRGRLICSFDTGVEQSHPALSAKWRGNHTSLSSSWFSPVKPDTLPFDATGHGTHTMGIMVGSVDADTFGVAPGAEWITAGVIDQGRSLSTTVGDILNAFQWILNPDGKTTTTDDVPDVILNSWGIPKGLFENCDQTFWQAIDNVEAAGIVTIFAAGNEGPNPSTIRIPADRSTTPINSFCVGAVDNNKVIATFSSRGPASCDPSQIKPEVVAPGVSIRSSTKGGTYAYMSGTSMAAPYIAGLVALCRQYNPDATVEQIKWAFIQSAEDLGDAGEDNNYGNGLVDASKLLNFLPAPVVPDFALTQSSVTGGDAAPGDSMQLTLQVSNPAANISEAKGRLVASDRSKATVTSDRSDLAFDAERLTAVNITPFDVTVGADVAHGDNVDFVLYIESASGTVLDSVEFSVPVGILPPGQIAEHTGGGLDFAVSDFGQYGFGPHSIYYTGQDGFVFDGGQNLLYEAGIIVSASGGRLSNSVRNSEGKFRVSDFSADEPITDGWWDNDGGYHIDAACNDLFSANPVPVEIHQETVDYHQAGDAGAVIVRYSLVNTGATTLDSLHFGFMADFDLSSGADSLAYNHNDRVVHQRGSNGTVVGLSLLENAESVTEIANGETKLGLTDTQKRTLVSETGVHLNDATGDIMFVVSSGPMTLEPGGIAVVSFALVAGSDLTDLLVNAGQAGKRYDSLSAGHNQRIVIPNDYVLNQNYPNPFNPVTTISFGLPTSQQVTLDIFNTLGQRVTRLVDGFLDAGPHKFEWNGTDEGGNAAATGVYFYRLSTPEFSQTKKMVLLK